MENLNILQEAFEYLRFRKIVKSQKEFAKLIGTSENSLSRALKGDEAYLTPNLITKVQSVYKYYDTTPTQEEFEQETILVIPTGARAGTLGDFAESNAAFDCERMVSPIRGADFAMQVTGDSMSPEYPSGSMVIIKKINEKIVKSKKEVKNQERGCKKSEDRIKLYKSIIKDRRKENIKVSIVKHTMISTIISIVLIIASIIKTEISYRLIINLIKYF